MTPPPDPVRAHDGWLVRVACFLRFVWRESPGGGRVSIRTAWELASILHGYRP